MCIFQSVRITFLGTGTSHGIPVIGCTCAVCLSPDPRNRRNRTGVWIREPGGPSAVLDVSSEFRIGALRHGLAHLDFVLLTHGHSDHISGLDDLRVFAQRTGRATPLYANAATMADIRHRFDYAFAPPRDYGGGVPQYEMREVKGSFVEGPWEITPLPVMHGPDSILGYRVNGFAFITDVTTIPEETLDLMRGLDVLALDCLRRQPHSTHLHFDRAVDYARRIGARRTYFIHMGHELEHAETERELPENIRLAYDGLELESP
jgi:phosphoribosyl 1,2-cyclic phosphate phosphodiesterase